MARNKGTDRQKTQSENEVLGKWYYNTKGEKAKVTNYNGYYNVELTFEDGEKIITDKQKLKLGYFNKPISNKSKSLSDIIREEYLGNTYCTKDGMEYKIIDIIDYKYSKILFLEYNIYQSVSHSSIISKDVKIIFNKNNAIGLKFVNKNNETAEIIKYNNSKDISLIFEDGEICKKPL